MAKDRVQPPSNESLRAKYEVELADMNNFTGHMPGGFYRDMIPSVVPEGKTFGEFLPVEMQENHSALYLSQMPAEFFAVIDGLLSQYGFTPEEVDPSRVVVDGASQKALKAKLAPIYIAMREMGYADYELNV